MDLTQFLTIAGISTVVMVLVEAIKRAAAWTDADRDRFAPLLAIILGILLAVTGSFVVAIGGVDPLIPGEIFGAFLTGILAGASASGLYSTVGKPAIVAVAGPA